MKLYIVTVATHEDGYLPYLKYSCKKYNYDLVILGYGEEWKGFNWKFKLVLNFLNSLKDDDIVCFVDGFDVICTRNLNELPNVFYNLKKKYNCKIIIAEHKFTDTYICKLLKFGAYLYFSKCKNELINSGSYIGNVYDIKKIIMDTYNINAYDNSDDQILLTKYCKNNQNNVYVDINNEIFLALQNPYNEIDQYLYFNKKYIEYENNSPFFIHGPSETYLDNIIIKLNYNYDYKNKVKDKLEINFYKKIYFRLKNSIFFNIFIFIILIIFIFIVYYIIKFL